MGEDGFAKVDETLQDPNCVFQLMKKHYSRYTPEMVSKIRGTPKDALPQGLRDDRRDRGAEQDHDHPATRWAGRSTRSARRTSAPWP